MALAPAEKQPLTTDRLREQLGRLGGTPFRLGHLANHLDGEVMLPVSELNRLRREIVAELERQRAQPKRWKLNPKGSTGVAPTTPSESVAEGHSCRHAANNPRDTGATQLIPLVRNPAQLDAALRCGVRTVYCDFEDPKKYRDAVQSFRTWQLTEQGCGEGSRQSAIFVAPPRIFKPGEEWQLEQVRSCQPDGYLVRNYDHLRLFANERCIGDFSLNITNHLSADYFIHRFGLERVTASYDLNVQQLEALLHGAPPAWFEITIHQHMPMFHMEHCVFCAFLSEGKDYRDCGRPCDSHDVKLRDRMGAEHPVKADVGCRNTVFNALAQTGAEYVEHMLTLGVQHFRVEFLNETPNEVERTLAKYRQLLRGELTGTQLWKELKLLNQLGVTRGQLAGVRSED
jgi:putative protease